LNGFLFVIFSYSPQAITRN